MISAVLESLVGMVNGVDWLSLFIQTVGLIGAATTAVWQVAKRTVRSEISFTEKRLGDKVEDVGDDVRRLEGRIEALSEEVRTNSRTVSVLQDRWNRLDNGV